VQIHVAGGQLLDTFGALRRAGVPAAVVVQRQGERVLKVVAVPHAGQVPLDVDEDRRKGQVGG